MVTTVTRVPNPAIAKVEEALVQAQTDLREAQSELSDTRAHAKDSNLGLDKYGMLERSQARLEREYFRATRPRLPSFPRPSTIWNCAPRPNTIPWW